MHKPVIQTTCMNNCATSVIGELCIYNRTQCHVSDRTVSGVFVLVWIQVTEWYVITRLMHTLRAVIKVVAKGGTGA